MKFVCPLLVVSDMERSRFFYGNLLELEVKYDFGENVTFHGDFSIHLGSHFQKLIGQRNIQNGENNFELYFERDDLEPLVEKLKKHQIRFVHDIQEQPWHQKVVRFYDPDGHLVEIGESMQQVVTRLHNQGMSEGQISGATSMPLDFVRQTLGEERGR